MNLFFKNKNLIYSVAFVIGCAVLATAYYSVEAEKRKSIEWQQSIENARAVEDQKRLDIASKQKGCEALSVGVRDRWNNAIGVTYDGDFWKECVVTYTDTKTGEITTTPLEFMKDVK